ncbi:cysteine desulfuration protein SufE [Arcticibacter tournemirensis]|uniref:SufE family protein n=1 Tax=Arcticibacter tournemirensis TaxID=699437 RepID=A0A4Q0MAZ5_9SPHI|nr:SufE family protein [Arcticibacter tournemirensis]KAA8485039.1 SufE family protein [Arcticibacter tournemirensis]RXF70384.1 SufE family protein [Arcticibacter tournemirensis]TQM50505.1 cysteine desulfuration protein SufE [Arcticibacter tournemirensis]
MTINEKQDELIEEFEFLTDWVDKYEQIIQLGKELPLIDEQYKQDKYLIKGCQSKVWLYPEFKEGRIFFSADSDAIISKGLVSLIINVLSGFSPEEIMNADLYFIDRIGLKEHLSPTRSNGLLAMVKQIKLYAIAYDAALVKKE